MNPTLLAWPYTRLAELDSPRSTSFPSKGEPWLGHQFEFNYHPILLRSLPEGTVTRPTGGDAKCNQHNRMANGKFGTRPCIGSMSMLINFRPPSTTPEQMGWHTSLAFQWDAAVPLDPSVNTNEMREFSVLNFITE